MTVSTGPRQLALALGHTESFAREDFLGGPSNAAALTLIESWPDWPGRAVALLDREAMRQQRPLTRALAAGALRESEA